MKYRLHRFAAALLLCLPLPGCFTAGLWTSDMRAEHKAALTPVSVALDVVTLPAQLAVIDGHHGHHHHHHRGHHRHRARRRCR
jgi:hypothetical protein